MPDAPQQNVNLVMPVGLPPAGTDAATHYSLLRTRLSSEVDATDVTHVWITNEDAYSGLFAMCKGFLRYFPVGTTAPNGTTLAAPMLTLKTWLWDYLALRQNASAGVTLPKLIGYGNVHPDSVRDAVRDELSTNPRYQSLDAAARTQAETDFMAGDAQMLASAATRIGRGAIESGGAHASQRRLDLTFLDRDGTNLDPHFFFDLWGLVAGPQVRNHPLMEMLARPVTPSQMPIEGGLRIRVGGTGFTTGTTVQIGGQLASDVAVNSTHSAVYATSPALPAGSVTVVVTIPSQPVRTFSNAITFTIDLLATVRAAALSYAIALSEIREQADALAAAGTLDEAARQRLQGATDLAGIAIQDVVATRSAATGGTLFDPRVSEVWESANNDLLALKTGILTTIS